MHIIYVIINEHVICDVYGLQVKLMIDKSCLCVKLIMQI
jgi:hypothetical protein